MDKNENRAVEGNDGAVRNHDLADSGSSLGNSSESFNAQPDGVELPIALAAPSDAAASDNSGVLAGVSLYRRVAETKPTFNEQMPWEEVCKLMLNSEVRENKDGYLIGGFLTAERRRNEDVRERSLVQLDIDTKVDKETGAPVAGAQAPLFDALAPLIADLEYVAHSTHGHDPAKGIVKYRITLLPGRTIKSDEEYRCLLEAFNERLGGVLDKGAWQWSQAFYLPSHPRERKGVAFSVHNRGARLTVDAFVAEGRRILNERTPPPLAQSPAHQPPTTPKAPRSTDKRSLPHVETMRDMLRFLTKRGDFAERAPWIKAGMALKVAYGDEVGFNLWRETHADSTAQVDAARQWKSFDGVARPHQITTGSIVKTATDAGYNAMWEKVPDGPLMPNFVDLSCFNTEDTDVANCKVFAKAFVDKILYISEDGKWLRFYQAVGWLPAPPGEADRAAKVVLQMLRDEASKRYEDAPDAPNTKRFMQHCKGTSRAQNLVAMVKLATSEYGIFARASEFDADPNMLGLPNGMFNLRTNTFVKPTPEHRISKRIRAEYDPRAESPNFIKFLERIQPDSEIRKFLQAFIGYCATGSVDQQTFVFFYGGGQNGKSAFVDLIAWLLGDYAHKIATEMLMQHQRNPQGASADIVGLKGVRLAFANETPKGARLDAERVKDLTGGGTLTGRGVYAREEISFTQTQKLLIVGNDKPQISDDSMAMWRRVRLVPFTVTIPEGERDFGIVEKLKNEASGILNWILEGCAMYQKGGLPVPEIVKAATDEYREDEDTLGDWIRDNLSEGSGLRADKTELYLNYQGWASTNGIKNPLTKKALTRRLGARRIPLPLSTDRRWIEGLGILPRKNVDPLVAEMPF